MRKVILIIIGIVVLVVSVSLLLGPMFLGCEYGVPEGLPIRCAMGRGDVNYDVTGDRFVIGSMATWKQRIILAHGVKTFEIDGTLDLTGEPARFVRFDDVTYIQGSGTIRFGGADFTDLMLIYSHIQGSGVLVLDGDLTIEANDIGGAAINLAESEDNYLYLTGNVTLDVTGRTVIGVLVDGDIVMEHTSSGDDPAITVHGDNRATGINGRGRIDLANTNLEVTGPEAVGVLGSGDEISLRYTRINVPDGVGVLMGEGHLNARLNSTIVGGQAAIRGDGESQIVELSCIVQGNVELAGGDDQLLMALDEFSDLDVDVSMGEGDDTVTIVYRFLNHDITLDGGDGDDELVINLEYIYGDDPPTEEDLAALDGVLELPNATIRWENFETVDVSLDQLGAK